MCGIVGVFNADNASQKAAGALEMVQSRALDFCGMYTNDGTNSFHAKGPGLVSDVLTEERLKKLHGRNALGHIRYPTVEDDPSRENIQPVVSRGVALAHNGNLTNHSELRDRLNAKAPLATSMDSECILRLFHESEGEDVAKLQAALEQVSGSYALVMMFKDKMIAARDPSGIRPLSIGRNGDAWFAASETTSLDMLDAVEIREVKPGEILIVDEYGCTEYRVRGTEDASEAPCVFEHVYFSQPASAWLGQSVAGFRLALGRLLADRFRDQNPSVSLNVITPVPDSANHIAEGFARAIDPTLFSHVLLRSHYVGRTFIAPTQAIRDWKVRRKFSVIRELVRDRVIGVVDDSIVRGTTLPKIVQMLRKADASEVHAMIAYPPIKYSCPYGINTPTREELMAHYKTTDDMRRECGADSLTMLSLEELQELAGVRRCYGCITGTYPTPV